MFAAAALTLAMVSCEDENEKPNTPSTGNDSIPEGYVDLGLPSGTLWKADNENRSEKGIGHFTFDEAYAAFGNQLPTKEQLEELVNVGSWEWNENGYVVTGINGNYIQLPAAGIRLSTTGNVNFEGTMGFYWSCTDGGPSDAWALEFNASSKNVLASIRSNERSVRLVHNP